MTTKMTPETLRRIEDFIRSSHLPRKAEKLSGLLAAFLNGRRLELHDDMILLDGIAIDPSELENGRWR
ncbi:MAG: hypothetical protein DCC68_24850 [Planctomycetota bacterium]|nr:MAG: hypothetical protein DCC68_24850 [Planctomycetota bacterium]